MGRGVGRVQKVRCGALCAVVPRRIEDTEGGSYRLARGAEIGVAPRFAGPFHRAGFHRIADCAGAAERDRRALDMLNDAAIIFALSIAR